jgi:hypothetical protein
VQAGPDEDIIEHALLAFESPQGTALDQVRRDGVSWFQRSRPPWASMTVSSRSVIAPSFWLAAFNGDEPEVRDQPGPPAGVRGHHLASQVVAGRRLHPCDCHAERTALVSARAQCKWPVMARQCAWRDADEAA